MNKTPEEVLCTLDSDKVFERIKTCAIFYLNNIEGNYKDVFLNMKLLRHAVESYFLDLNRMKEFHGIDYADRHKRAAFTMLWMTRVHPIQLHTHANMTEALIIINEIFAVGLGLGHLQLSMKDISSDYIRNLLYTLHFRSPSPEVLASSMYVLECAVNQKKP